MQTMTLAVKIAMPGDVSTDILKRFADDLMSQTDLADLPVVVNYRIIGIKNTPDPAPEPMLETTPWSLEEPQDTYWDGAEEWEQKTRPIITQWLEQEYP